MFHDFDLVMSFFHQKKEINRKKQYVKIPVKQLYLVIAELSKAYSISLNVHIPLLM